MLKNTGRWRRRPGRRGSSSARGRRSQSRRPLKGGDIARGGELTRGRRRRHRGRRSSRRLLSAGERGATTVKAPKVLGPLGVVTRTASRQMGVEAPLGTEQSQTQQALVGRLERWPGEIEAPMEVVDDAQRGETSLAPETRVLTGGKEHVAGAQRADRAGVVRGDPLLATPKAGAEEVGRGERVPLRSRHARSGDDSRRRGVRKSRRLGVGGGSRRGPSSGSQTQRTQGG